MMLRCFPNPKPLLLLSSTPKSPFSSLSLRSFPKRPLSSSTSPITPNCRASRDAPPPHPHPANPRLAAAVSLIVGTAVGPGMLGLPAATLRSGPLPSTFAVILSWLYVISSILLVAELSFAAMRETSVEEVSFTGLAADAFGVGFGSLVAIVYASLSFALVIACISGIGSLVSQLFGSVPVVVANAVFPSLVGLLITFLPFQATDAANRALCAMMVVSIVGLMAVGMSVGRTHLLDSFKFASWSLSAILPAIPVTVLTLGFHVITPFMCKIVGGSVYDARKAVLVGGAVPLAMVLSWNLVILGLSSSTAAASGDPIGVLLSVNPSALPAVQGFAFTALATSLIGYSVSFPKQLIDTIDLMWGMSSGKRMQEIMADRQAGTAGFVKFRSKGYTEDIREAFAIGSKEAGDHHSDDGYAKDPSGYDASKSNSGRNIVAMWAIIFTAVLVGTYLQAAFSKALDFAGIYANCFLFGILPPAMAWIHRSRQRNRSFILLPGGNAALLILFVTSMLLLIWH